MLLFMTNSRQERMETLGEAAARLLRRLSENAKRPAGERPAEIAESGEVPRAGEKAGSRGETGEATPQGSPQLTVTGRGVGDGLVLLANNDNWRDRSLIEGMETPVASAGGVQRMGS